MSQSKEPLLDALADVRAMRKHLLVGRLFCGYSGVARIEGGCLALLGAFIFSREWFPAWPPAHVVGWGVVCALAALLNLGALGYWWRRTQADLDRLLPVLDIAAPFVVGGLLTAALLVQASFNLLVPMWMWLFGLMNISSRHSMPTMMVYLGWYYIVAGTLCAWPFGSVVFTNPWPMGIIFFVGEAVGGITFLRLRKENADES